MNESKQTSVFTSLLDYAKALASGMGSIWRALTTSMPYLFKVRSGEHRKEVTEQYPDPVSSRMPDDLPPRSRGFLWNDITRCTGCGDCEKVCPVQCITVETEKGPEAAKTWISVFDIDFARCTFCGFCTEVCAPNSLVHQRKYEGAVDRLDAVVKSFGMGRVTQEQRAKWAAIRRAQEMAEGRLT
jgi:formate hydrogenlyase subunit 6/NADH:ubiquinone oxidoreductase subunit I